MIFAVMEKTEGKVTLVSMHDDILRANTQLKIYSGIVTECEHIWVEECICVKYKSLKKKDGSIIFFDNTVLI